MSDLITINAYAKRNNISHDAVRHRVAKEAKVNLKLKPVEYRHASTGGHLWVASELDKVMKQYLEEQRTVNSAERKPSFAKHLTTKLTAADTLSQTKKPAKSNMLYTDVMSEEEYIASIMISLKNDKNINDDMFKFALRKLVRA